MKGVDTCTIVAEEQQKQFQNITLAIQKGMAHGSQHIKPQQLNSNL